MHCPSLSTHTARLLLCLMAVGLSGCPKMHQKIPPTRRIRLVTKKEEKVFPVHPPKESSDKYTTKKVDNTIGTENQYQVLDNTDAYFTEGYQRMIKKGKDEKFARVYAGIYSVERRHNKDYNFANHYAYQIAHGKSETFAFHFAEKVAIEKSLSWANAYANAIESGEKPLFATTVADVYTEKKSQGMATQKAKKEARCIALEKICAPLLN